MRFRFLVILVSILLPAGVARAASSVKAVPAKTAAPAAAVTMPATATAAPKEAPIPTAKMILSRAMDRMLKLKSYRVKFTIYQNKTDNKIDESLVPTRESEYRLTVRCDRPGGKVCAIRLDALRGAIQKTTIAYDPSKKNARVVIRRPQSVTRVTPDDIRAVDFFQTPVVNSLSAIVNEMNGRELITPNPKGTEPIQVPKETVSRAEGGWMVELSGNGRRTFVKFDGEFNLRELRVVRQVKKRSGPEDVLDTLVDWIDYQPDIILKDNAFEVGTRSMR